MGNVQHVCHARDNMKGDFEVTMLRSALPIRTFCIGLKQPWSIMHPYQLAGMEILWRPST